MALATTMLRLGLTGDGGGRAHPGPRPDTKWILSGYEWEGIQTRAPREETYMTSPMKTQSVVIHPFRL